MSPFVRTSPLLLLVLLLDTACASRQRDPERAAAPQSTTHVSAQDIERNPTQSPEELLRGRVSGVTVTRSAEGGIAVRIRGGSSAYYNNEPLYILDGMPFEPGPGGVLSGVQIGDIESIRVLKDAAETSMYGARGANGVIVIKTKQGSTPRKTP